MFDLILLAAGLVGFGAAAYWDLRFTEFPDQLPYLLIVTAVLVRTAQSLITGDFFIIGNSLVVGAMFLLMGLLLYHAKQWGDGDAWLLGALGFLFPSQAPFGAPTVMPFPLTLLSNFLFISLLYLVTYSLILGLGKSRVNRSYLKTLKSKKYRLAGLIFLFFAVSWSLALYSILFMNLGLNQTIHMLGLPFLLAFILLFSYYAKNVEDVVFRKKVKTSELREGDVVMDDKWRGLKAEEVKELRKKKKYIWVKEGVRFAPVFILTLIISILWGDMILILF